MSDACVLERESLYRELGVAAEARTMMGARDMVVVEKDHLILKEANFSETRHLLRGSDYRLAVGPGEVRCSRCGTRHRNPLLLLCYRLCHVCGCVLKEPSDIVPPVATGLRALAATYGHPTDASLAVDVTVSVEALARREGFLEIRKEDDLRRVLGVTRDPAPRTRKVLRIRYAIEGVRGEATVEEGDFPFHLKGDFCLRASKVPPLVTLASATYGHPLSTKGAASFDVRDALQYRVDVNEGKFLEVSRQEDLRRIFGDPCRGRPKHLVIAYEIRGKRGEVTEFSGGILQKRISLEAAPCLLPQIIISKATYGWTTASLSDYVDKTTKDLRDLENLDHRKNMGLAVTAHDRRRLRLEMPKVHDMLRILKTTLEEIQKDERQSSTFVDVTALLQRRVEVGGGDILYVGGDNNIIPDWLKVSLRGKEKVGIDTSKAEDLSKLFGDPLPDLPLKRLYIEYAILGHDTEGTTETADVTSEGIETNFIRTQPKVVVDVLAYTNPETQRTTLERSVVVGVTTTLPSINITYASWGNAADASKVCDVTDTAKNMTTHRGLHIPTGSDLIKLFGDPCPGTQKKLHIKYFLRGFRGKLRVDEDPLNRLRTNLRLGYFADDNLFAPPARRPYRDEAIERDIRLRMSPEAIAALPANSPYHHLSGRRRVS